MSTRPWVIVTRRCLEEEYEQKRRAKYHVFWRRPGRRLRVDVVWSGTVDGAWERVLARHPDCVVETIAITDGGIDRALLY